MKAEFERQLTERDATIDRLNRKIAELESKGRDDDGKNHMDYKELEEFTEYVFRYALGEFPCLMRCLEDGSLQFSNNICEQQMRSIAIYRNNSLFVGSIESAKTFARINSYVQSCRLCGVNTFKWICSLPDNLVKLSKESLRAWLPDAMKSDSNLCVCPALI